MTRNVPVLFEGTMFPEITVLTNPDFIPDGALNLIDAEVESKIAIECTNRDERRYVAELRVRTGIKPADNVPYKIDILCISAIQIDPDVPEENIKQLALRASHAMTFPAIREMILTLTARQPWGQFSIGMSSLASAKKQVEPQNTSKPASKKPRLKKAVSK